jgi:hypothetical protein
MMKNLIINISENDFINYDFQKETLTFDELVVKIKAKLIKPAQAKVKFEETPAFNLWQDRDDMADAETYVEQLRKPRQVDVH